MSKKHFFRRRKSCESQNKSEMTFSNFAKAKTKVNWRFQILRKPNQRISRISGVRQRKTWRAAIKVKNVEIKSAAKETPARAFSLAFRAKKYPKKAHKTGKISAKTERNGSAALEVPTVTTIPTEMGRFFLFRARKLRPRKRHFSSQETHFSAITRERTTYFFSIRLTTASFIAIKIPSVQAL